MINDRNKSPRNVFDTTGEKKCFSRAALMYINTQSLEQRSLTRRRNELR